MFGANGMVVYRQKRAEYQSLRHEIDDLQKENDHYTGQIDALQTDPKTIEKEAREQLHYARPGEVVIVVPGASADPDPLHQRRPEVRAGVSLQTSAARQNLRQGHHEPRRDMSPAVRPSPAPQRFSVASETEDEVRPSRPPTSREAAK